MPRIILTLVLFLVSVFANAQTVNTWRTGENFIQLWRAWQKGMQLGVNLLSGNEWRDFNQYEGLVTGYAEGITMGADEMETICFPDGVRESQLRQVVSNYLEDNPTQWNDPPLLIVFDAFEKAWPCNN